MAKRFVQYRLKGEVLEKAKRMCGRKFEDRECPEFEKVKRNLERIEKVKERLKEYIGKTESFPFKEGQIITHPRTKIQTRILKKYKDLLDNEKVLTELIEKHIKAKINDSKIREWRRFVRKWGRKNLANILKNPDLILYDRKRRAIVYTKKVSFKNIWRMAGVVVGFQNRHYIFTIEPMPLALTDRYVVIYDKEKDGVL